MSSTTDKIRGTANRVVGSAKRGIGRVTGNTRLQAEGHAQEIKGTAQTAVGNARQGVKTFAAKVKGGR